MIAEQTRQTPRPVRRPRVDFLPEEKASNVKQVEKVKLSASKQDLLGNFFMLVVLVLGYTVKPCHWRWGQFQMARKRSLVLAPRELGKSLILTVSYIIWLILNNPNIRILIVSNSSSAASKMLAGIVSHFENNKILRAIFGDFIAGGRCNTEAFTTGKRTAVGLREATISIVGVYGTIVSGHFDVIIADDLCDFENTRTKPQRDKMWSWLWMVLMPTLESNEEHPEKDGSIHFIGTRYHHDDLYGRLIGKAEEPGAYWDNHLRDQALVGIGMAASLDIKDLRMEEMRTLWPEKKSIQRLLKIRKDSGSIIFGLQYQNDAEGTKGRIFQMDWFIHRYDIIPENCMIFAGTDLAVKQDDSADFFTIVVIAVDPVTKHIYILDGVKIRLTAPKQLDRIKQFYQTWKFVTCGIESVAYQEALVQWAVETTDVPVRGVTRHSDKVLRAYKIQHFFENGKVFLPHGGKFVDLVDEMVLFPDGEHDDWFDALETAIDVAFSGNFNFAFAA